MSTALPDTSTSPTDARGGEVRLMRIGAALGLMVASAVRLLLGRPA